jgi:predicted DNA-binding protein YlxM (UPF0122 family)
MKGGLLTMNMEKFLQDYISIIRNDVKITIYTCNTSRTLNPLRLEIIQPYDAKSLTPVELMEIFKKYIYNPTPIPSDILFEPCYSIPQVKNYDGNISITIIVNPVEIIKDMLEGEDIKSIKEFRDYREKKDRYTGNAVYRIVTSNGYETITTRYIKELPKSNKKIKPVDDDGKDNIYYGRCMSSHPENRYTKFYHNIPLSIIDKNIDNGEYVCKLTDTKIRHYKVNKIAMYYAYPKNLFLDIYFGGAVFNYTKRRAEKMIELCKETLTQRDLFIVESFYKNMMTQKDIADDLNLSPTAVKQVLLRFIHHMLCRENLLQIIKVHKRESINVIDDSVYSEDIASLNISCDGLLKLIKSGIDTVGQMIQFTKYELHTYIGLTESDVNIIINELENIGVSLADYL